MSSETLVVALIVGGALFFIGRRAWRAVQSARGAGASSCNAGCGCEAGPPSRTRDWGET